jgi:hypothetical protein
MAVNNLAIAVKLKVQFDLLKAGATTHQHFAADKGCASFWFCPAQLVPQVNASFKDFPTPVATDIKPVYPAFIQPGWRSEDSRQAFQKTHDFNLQNQSAKMKVFQQAEL